MSNMKLILENWKRFISEEVQFSDSPDEDKPGNNQIVMFNKDEKYEVSGETHGKMSHAIKHFLEFDPNKVKAHLTKAIQVAKQLQNVFLVSAKDGSLIADGDKAKAQLTDNAMLNTFDFISDKIKNNQQLSAEEQKLLPIIQQMTQEYEAALNAHISNAVDVDNITDEQKLKELIDGKNIIKFTGNFKGTDFIYYLNTSNTGMAVSDKNNTFSTFFRFDKKGGNLSKFPKGTVIKNAALKKAIGLEAPPAQQTQPMVVSEGKIMKINEKYLKQIIKEALLKEQLSQEIQKLVDQNQFLKGKLTAKDEDLVQGSKFVLVLPEESLKHIKERHMDGSKPGSLLNPNIDLKKAALALLNKQPSEAAGGRVKWLGVDSGQQIGSMGVAKADPQALQNMTDYQMPDGKKEKVKIAAGKRTPTNELTLITAELGNLSDGRKALSLITMFPGGIEIDGVQIPPDRGEFAAKGLYFPIDANSPLLQAQKPANAPVSENKNLTKQTLKQIIKEEFKKLSK